MSEELREPRGVNQGLEDFPHHGEIFQPPIATPEPFDPGLAIAEPPEKTPEVGNPAHGCAQTSL